MTEPPAPPPAGRPPPPPPPPPPPLPRGGRAVTGSPLDLGVAFRFGWEATKRQPGPIVGGLAALLLAVTVGTVVGWLAVTLLLRAGGAAAVAGLGIGVVLLLVLLVGSVVVQVVIVRASLDVVDGRRLAWSRLVRRDGLGRAAGTAVLVALGVLVGTVLCYLPGLVFQFLAAFALHVVVDEDRSPTDAIRASVDLVRSQPGSAVLLVIVTQLVAGLGWIACGVGLLVSMPVALIAQAHGYRQLRGGPTPPVVDGGTTGPPTLGRRP